MKKFGILCVCLLGIIGLLFHVVHSSWMQKKGLVWAQTALQDSGWSVSAGNVKSIFPTLDAETITVQTPEGTLQIGSAQGKISLWRLLKKEIYFDKIEIDRISFSKISERPASPPQVSSAFFPFRLKVHSLHLTHVETSPESTVEIETSLAIKINLEKNLQIRAKGLLWKDPCTPLAFRGEATRHLDGRWTLDSLYSAFSGVQLKAKGALDAQGALSHAAVEIKTEHLHLETPIAPITYQILAHIDLFQKEGGMEAITTWQIPSLQIGEVVIEQIGGSISSLYRDGLLKSEGKGSFEFAKAPWTFSFPFTWQDHTWTFPEITLLSSVATAQGNLLVQGEEMVSAYVSFSIPLLYDLSNAVYGKASGRFSLETVGCAPFYQLDSEIVNFSYASAKADHLWLSGSWSQGMWEASCDVEGGRFHTLHLDTGHIETNNTKEEWPILCTLQGSWVHPLSLDLTGSWHFKDQTWNVWLEHAAGSFFNNSLALLHPTHLVWGSAKKSLQPFDLQIADGKISSLFTQEKGETHLELNLRRVPLNLISLNPLDVSVGGFSDLSFFLKGPNDALEGDLIWSVQNVEMLLLGQTEPLQAQGQITAHLEKDLLQMQGNLTSEEKEILSFDFAAPLHLEVEPFHMTPLYAFPVRGHLSFASKLEQFLDFFDLGTHRIEGNCTCHFTLSGTLGSPRLQGEGRIEEGMYQNYYTGTELQNIYAEFRAQNQELRLTSLIAKDLQNEGRFEASGVMKLIPQEHFPFGLTLTVHRFKSATFDLISTEANGTLQIEGNLLGARATGDLEVVESDITIPSRVPKQIPKLDVVYKHAYTPPAPIPLPQRSTYPLELDLTVRAPDGIFISGRGIESEWKGEFHVGGSQIDLATQGNIELIQGNFLFSGRSFKLTEGSLKFSGIPGAQPTLHLAASIQVKDVLITVFLKGPLNDPQITLQSSPPLAMGTIMAYLLFGQDIGELDSSQALRFASALTSLAGEGPGILEETKKSLGIDRIQVITVPSQSAEGGETIAVQVGKYVTEGVLVSYSQGAENSSQNINIEVELQGNLTFILESDQNQEQSQGKFTIKWNKTY